MTASKALLFLLKSKKVRKVIIGLIGSIILLIFFFCISGELLTVQGSTALADTANREYESWRGASPQSKGYSCQGEKYCNHFHYGIVDWCAIFVGYCVDKSGYDTNEFGFSASVPTWVSNLKAKGKIADAGSYTPKVGNLIFFDYSGRQHYRSVGRPGHIGIVVQVKEDEVTIIAGNEYNGATSNWASVSYVNKYTKKLSDDSIACYGTVGADDITTFSLNLSGSTNLVKVTRNVITHNEIGVFYEDIKPSQFGSVVANDNGAVSIGVYGWHANNARELLQTAYSINSSEVTRVCRSYGSTGSYILSAIKNSASWKSFIPSSAQSNCIKAIILTEAGKKAQDKKSLEYVNSYIKICREHGLSNGKAIAYCSDILNQWGTGSFGSNVYASGSHGVLYGVNGKMSLKSIYQSKAGWGSSGQYKNRRTWTYNFLNKSKLR